MKTKNEPPLVMCITNTVAANFTANCLLAIGAKPAMVEETSEAAELTEHADAILINLGTITPTQCEVMRAAVKVAAKCNIPWVLDPVAVHVLGFRRQFCRELLAFHPALIRGNHAEIKSIFADCATACPQSAILSTGEIDLVYPNAIEKPAEISGGVALLQSVTATGCAQGAISAAYLGWGEKPTNACLSSSKLLKRAGEKAYRRAATAGSFQIALIDALWELTHD